MFSSKVTDSPRKTSIGERNCSYVKSNLPSFWQMVNFTVNCTCTIVLLVVKTWNQRADKTGYDILTVTFWVS